MSDDIPSINELLEQVVPGNDLEGDFVSRVPGVHPTIPMAGCLGLMVRRRAVQSSATKISGIGTALLDTGFVQSLKRL